MAILTYVSYDYPHWSLHLNIQIPLCFYRHEKLPYECSFLPGREHNCTDGRWRACSSHTGQYFECLQKDCRRKSRRRRRVLSLFRPRRETERRQRRREGWLRRGTFKILGLSSSAPVPYCFVSNAIHFELDEIMNITFGCGIVDGFSDSGPSRLPEGWTNP
jgi:hypothetical protein